ncbi:Wzz/FepE/Etk N-terminal domain-containing protein [Staphylococcus borealis]
MENTLDLSKFMNAIKKNWKLIVLLPIILMLISLLVTVFLMKPKYEANTQVLVNQKEKNAELMAQEVQSNIQLVNTYSEILKSPRIIEDVAKKNSKYSAEDIKGMLTVTTQAESQILNVTVKNGSKKDAEKVANVFSDKMPEIMNVDNVSVLSKANGTATKVSPNLLLNLAIGLILGIIIAMMIVVLKELFDRRIRTEEDVKRELDIPVLGSIQKLK